MQEHWSVERRSRPHRSARAAGARRGHIALFAGMMMLLALPLCASQASAALSLGPPLPTFTSVQDENGADDQPGQKDLNVQGVGTLGPNDLWVTWQWDDTSLSGGNTGDACALFDTDTNSKVNFAVCVSIESVGGKVDATQIADSPRVYTCGDGKVDRCTSTYNRVMPINTACATNTNATDPFHNGKKDTQATCHIDLADVGGAGTANLINTCSYPSQSPTSAPSDCVLIPRDAFLRIAKVADPSDAGSFPFRLGLTTEATPGEVFTANGSQTSPYIAIRSDKPYKLKEDVPAGWAITGTPSCTGTSGSGSSPGSFSVDTISGIDASPDNTITCTFNDMQLGGSLSVHKYIDIDESGTESGTGIETGMGVSPVTGTDLGGWSITITGPNGFSCTGATTSSGVLASCGTANLASLAPGSYTVTENANASKTIGSAPGSAYFNTDPGTVARSETVTVTSNGATSVSFGNACFNTATFQVTGVPSDQSGLFVRYWTTDPAATTDVNMTNQGSGTWKATAGSLHAGTVVHWEFGLGSDTSTRVAGTDITLPGYPACGAAQSKAFGTATISGTKYKDIDVSGTRNGSEGGLAGFTIQLKKAGNVIRTTKSDATGAFSFGTIDPGTYTLHELSETGWSQTEPASGDITVTVPLGVANVSTYGSAIPIRFGNTPLSTVGVQFNSLAQLKDATGADTGPATRATSIDCSHGGADVGSSSNSNTNTTGSLDLNKSTVTCVITFVDP